MSETELHIQCNYPHLNYNHCVIKLFSQCSAYSVPLSLNFSWSSNVQGYDKREHRIMCAMFYVATPCSYVVSHEINRTSVNKRKYIYFFDYTFRFDVDMKFEIPDIVFDPPIENIQTALDTVARAISDIPSGKNHDCSAARFILRTERNRLVEL